MEVFSAQACIRFGWETFKKRPWYLVGIMVLTSIPQAVFGIATNHTAGVSNGIITLLSWIVQILVGFAMLCFFIRAHDDIEHVTLHDLWRPNLVWKYAIAGFLQFLALIGGLILLIVPGIIFGIMFGFATYLAIDQALRPMEAMRESRRITDGHKWELFLLGFLSLLIGILGFICLLVGLLAAIPVIYLSAVHAYRVLQQQAGPRPITA